jgi:hypothetical protein
MVAFRKLFPVLAVFALLLGATSAYAQGATGSPLQCIANAGVPPVVRAEGYTELVGDIVITCTGGNPAAPFFANFQLFLNTNITSRLIGSNQSEALLMIDEPGVTRTDVNGQPSTTTTPFCVAAANNNSLQTACNPLTTTETYQQLYNTVFYASRVQEGTGARENAIVWPGVPVVPPGTNRTRTFRITNVRANAAGLGASQTLIPTQIVAFVSVTPPGTLPIDNPQQVVGYVQQGLLFAVRSRSDGGSSINVDQCVSAGANRNLRSDPLDPDENLTALGTFRFREGFQTAFKTQIQAGQDGAVPGQVFNSESGFVRTTALAGTTGIAESGTRLAARFQNVPANMRVFVTTTNVGSVDTLAASRAVFVSTDPNGATFGTASATRVVTEPFSGGSTMTGFTVGGSAAGDDFPLIEVPIVNGTGVAVWEVTITNPSSNEDFFFGYGLGYTHQTGSNQVGVGTATVIGNLAPFYPTGTNAERMNSLLPIPRFVSRTDTINAINVQPCRTNLLFPYVTNWAGFDTGMSIANTSQDPFSDPQDRTQGGRCTLNYYGTLQNGQAPTTTREQTNADVAAGQTITLVLSTGGSLGLRGNANFQGYIIAQCDFLFAHGFAFITEGPIGQARVAVGYLALVLDVKASDTDSMKLRGGDRGENRGH